MLIEAFGPGCAKCQVLEKHAHQAVERSGGNHEVVKVSDYAAMAARASSARLHSHWTATSSSRAR